MKFRAVLARQRACVVGLFDDDDLELDELLDAVKKYPPCVAELTEANVQAIFDRCLAKEGCAETSYSHLYLKELGYEREDTGIVFDKKIILENRRNIEYLFGQLGAVHHGQLQLKEGDFSLSYSGKSWTVERASIMQLIYLSAANDIKIINKFIAKYQETPLCKAVTPTLSPKDPAFPAWWEEHKGEWEA